MMTESEILKLIRQTIRQELAQTLMGNITSTDDAYFTSVKRFDTDSEINDLRLIRPYGFASRPPSDTPTVAHPINGDPSHIVSLGDFDDTDRPLISSGDSAMYNELGKMVAITNVKIRIGSLVASNPLVLGDILQTFCDNLITILTTVLTAIETGPIAVTTTPGNPAPTYPALAIAIQTAITNLATLKTTLVDSPLTNFLSQESFTERIGL